MIICERLLFFWGGGLKSTMGGIGALKHFVIMKEKSVLTVPFRTNAALVFTVSALPPVSEVTTACSDITLFFPECSLMPEVNCISPDIPAQSMAAINH